MNQLHLDYLASPEWQERLREVVVPFAIGPTDLGDDLLELGPGPGLTTDLLRERAASITAVELDEALATQLAARLAGTNVEVLQGDATDLPFPSGRFSGAVSFTMLHHVPTAELQDRIFVEVARVLRPGGVFVVSDSVASEELAAAHHDDIYNPVDPGTVEARLLAAGFARVDVEAGGRSWRARAHTAA